MIRIINQVCCISFDSYIKPQLVIGVRIAESVVYLLIPTSNHNMKTFHFCYTVLYIFWFLHQTTTERWTDASNIELYIFWFLHQTTTLWLRGDGAERCISFDSYIKPQRWGCESWTDACCISFDSYIKPQLASCSAFIIRVVYLLIPTSNHNYSALWKYFDSLYIFWFLHQTTTPTYL